VYEVIGDQTQGVADRWASKFNQVFRQSERPIDIFVDLRNMGKSSLYSRKAAAEIIKNDKVARIALFGANIFTRTIAKFIISASGKSEKIQFFDDKEQAIRWLKK
jgi:hypothetical protein